MSIVSTQLPAALQTLIDSRLDTIDRMLLGRLPRQDRVAIVREVESQVFELLHEQGIDEPSRDDVLAALARLDPPEAYLPDDDEPRDAPTPRPRSAAVPRSVAHGQSHAPRTANAAGIFGIVSLSLVIAGPLLCMFAEVLASASMGLAYVFIFGAIGLMFVGAVLGITLGVIHRRSGALPTVGIVTGIATLLGMVSIGFSYMLMT